MRFGYTIVYVQSVENAVAFYERAFGLTRRFVADDNSYGELDTGATTLAFASNELAAGHLPHGFRHNDASEPPGAFEIAFLTDDVPAAYQHALSCGATPVAPPSRKPWGQTVSYVRDPDGLLVEICTPVG